MPQQVCMGATLTCSSGNSPSSLIVLPTNRVMTNAMPAANIMDHKPLVNISPFGMCSSLANPAVSSATTAALGVLTPMPCIPVTIVPWAPGSPTVQIAKFPALKNTCSLQCQWGGTITINNAGQTTHQVG